MKEKISARGMFDGKVYKVAIILIIVVNNWRRGLYCMHREMEVVYLSFRQSIVILDLIYHHVESEARSLQLKFVWPWLPTTDMFH